jgi:hypothetical protein
MKKLIIGVAIGSVLTYSLPALAESISVELNKINVQVNNSPVTGENILYNGRTYVPLRAISEMLGKDVVWNSDNNTAYINDKLPPEWSNVVTFEGETSKTTESFKILGKESKITWSNYGDGYLSATLYNSTDNTYQGLIVNDMKNLQNQITYLKKSGEYYLKITATNRYSIKIEQRP